MHEWGDGTDFQKITQIAEMIGDFCKRWGRINVMDSKEKWGTVRVYVRFGWHDLHSIVYPGYAYNQWANTMRYIDTLLGPLIRKLNFLVIPYQEWIYKLAYNRALDKHPEFREEILCCCDFPEYL
jgi:hypothetical protein